MGYVIYALFQVPGAADQALQEISRSVLPKRDYQVFIHKNGISDEQRSSDSDGGKGVTIGLGVGAMAGALFGALLCGPYGFLRMPLMSAIGFGMLVGLAIGAFASGIYGSGLLHRNLARLVRMIRPGQILITAEMETLESRDAISQILKKHGAIEASRTRSHLLKIPPNVPEPIALSKIVRM